MSEDRSIVTLRRPRRVWAVGAIHGDAARLAALHQQMRQRIAYGDRLIYLGNFLGYGAAISATIA